MPVPEVPELMEVSALRYGRVHSVKQHTVIQPTVLGLQKMAPRACLRKLLAEVNEASYTIRKRLAFKALPIFPGERPVW